MNGVDCFMADKIAREYADEVIANSFPYDERKSKQAMELWHQVRDKEYFSRTSPVPLIDAHIRKMVRQCIRELTNEK